MKNYFCDIIKNSSRLATKRVGSVVKIIPLPSKEFSPWLIGQPARIKNLVALNNFAAERNTFCLLPDVNGNLTEVILGVENADDFEAFGILPSKLPAGTFQIVAPEWSSHQLERAALGWGMGCYRYDVYKKRLPSLPNVRLVYPENCDKKLLLNYLKSIYLVRDLINTPAEDHHPATMMEVATKIAKNNGATVHQIVGDDLLRKNFPAIHAVGRGSARAPRLVVLTWGNTRHPKLVLVGKGVCFDSGGLHIKSAENMLLMKTDMAGAAHALALGELIMQAKLQVHLQIIIPAVENMPSGLSYKPGDIVKTRKGISIEITDTDAEGRIILADALCLACESKPQMVIDFATLTGAATIALGSKISAMYTDHDQVATDIAKFAIAEKEWLWRMPLYKPYRKMLGSYIADIANSSQQREAGSIRAALFLQEFVTNDVIWVHFDMHGWNMQTEPAHPQGGEAVCLRGLFKYLQQKFSKHN